MAEETLKVTFTWENGKYFKMETKAGDDDAIVVVKVEENGDIANLWSSIQDICLKTVTRFVGVIGDEMKEGE